MKLCTRENVSPTLFVVCLAFGLVRFWLVRSWKKMGKKGAKIKIGAG